MKNSTHNNSGDGRLPLLLLLLSGLLLVDCSSGRQWWIFSAGSEEISFEHLSFSPPNKLIVEKVVNKAEKKSGGQLPPELTPFFFEALPINLADKDMLMTVRGIGPAMAEDILEYRRRVGLFNNSADLLNLRGIGPKRAARFSSVFKYSEVP